MPEIEEETKLFLLWIAGLTIIAALLYTTEPTITSKDVILLIVGGFLFWPAAKIIFAREKK